MVLPSGFVFARPWILVVAGLAAGLACATAQNHLDPDRPLYTGSCAAAPPHASEAETAGLEMRVVTFHIEYAKRVPQAIAGLRAHPELGAPDVLALQEMDAPGVVAVAQALALNYVSAAGFPGNNDDLVFFDQPDGFDPAWR